MTQLISGTRVLDHAALQLRIAQAASGLRSLGVGKGDGIALLMRNDFAFFEATSAAGLVGAYTTPVNWHFTAEEADYILTDCGAKVLVAHTDLLTRIAPRALAGLRVFTVPTPPEIRAAFAITQQDAQIGAHEDWDAWLRTHPPITDPSPSPPGSIIYTSGSTGRPKGVRRLAPTPDQIAQRRTIATHVYGMREGQEPVVLMTGPMYHSAPNAYGFLSVQFGATVILQTRFDAQETLALVERYRVSHMHMVPTMFSRLVKLPDDVRRRYDLSSLRCVLHGAAPCPAPLKRAMIEWWGPIICEYYGSTETGIPVWHDSHEALRKPGTVGRILDGAVVKAFDEAGNELGPGQVGELYMRSRTVTDFTYQGRPADRAAAGHGDLVSVGDIGWIDGDGYVFLCDRKRDMVISGGVNIYPAEIEAALMTLPGIRDCAVFGIPDDEFGESLCAWIEPEAGTSLDAIEIRSDLASKLARFKIPKVIEFTSALPREDTGKIFKRKLRDPYWARTGRSI